MISNMNTTLEKILLELMILNTSNNKKTKKRKANSKTSTSQKSAIPQGISNIISNALKQAKASRKDKKRKNEKKLEDTAEEIEDGKGKDGPAGGYGTIKPYVGMSPYAQYADYNKIWKHIGSFTTNGAYGNSFEKASLRSSVSESTGILVSMEVIEKAQKHFKYFVRGDVMGDVGYVPPFGAGIDSKDWEKYRMMTQMSIYMPLLKLMRSVI